MFDPWQQSRLNAGLDKVKSAKLPERDTSIDDLKKLSGVSNPQQSFTTPSVNRAQVMREQNIRPGTEEWFKLWFGKAR
jgi:hypothetical protein